MHHLFVGPDITVRDKILVEIKTRYLKTPEAQKFDFASLDAKSLSLNELKAAVMTVPAVAERRVILISRADKLDDQALEFIEQAVSADDRGYVLVIEAMTWDRRNVWRKRIADRMKVAAQEKKLSAFDLLDTLRTGPGAMLAGLPRLLETDAVENVLGAARWWWVNKAKGTVSASGYKEGLRVIQQADERIKSSSLVREQALEAALVRLSLLAGSWRNGTCGGPRSSCA
jgi:DNA polymerase III delta subunit